MRIAVPALILVMLCCLDAEYALASGNNDFLFKDNNSVNGFYSEDISESDIQKNVTDHGKDNQQYGYRIYAGGVVLPGEYGDYFKKTFIIGGEHQALWLFSVFQTFPVLCADFVPLHSTDNAEHKTSINIVNLTLALKMKTVLFSQNLFFVIGNGLNYVHFKNDQYELREPVYSPEFRAGITFTCFDHDIDIDAGIRSLTTRGPNLTMMHVRVAYAI